MPAFLSGLFTSALAGLLDFFVKRFSVKVGVAASFLVVILGLTAAFILALNAAISSASHVMPAFLTEGFGMFMPSNTIVCLTAMFSAQVARFIFDQNRYIVKTQMQILS